MLILFDHNIPRAIRHSLQSHIVEEAKTRGWDRLSNGELLAAAESAGFNVLLTADQGFSYQQSLKYRKIAVVILSKGQWPYIKPVAARIIDAVNAAQPGTITVVDIPVP
jgi:predicted nuclease of predicted toxin-antitoxin system